MMSFIIPTLNEEQALPKILQCLSTFSGPHEIIISDGGSTDKTVEIARRYTDKISVYSGSKRQTIAEGRNAGAAIASGDLIVFLDADLTIYDVNNFFNRLQNFFDVNNRAVAATVFLRVLSEHRTFLDAVIFDTLNYGTLFLNNFLHIGAAFGEFQMIRRSVFEKAGGFNPFLAVGEDQELFRRIRKYGETRCFDDLVVYHTGRRAHKIGWPKLLAQWTMNEFSVLFFGRSAENEWKEVR